MRKELYYYESVYVIHDFLSPQQSHDYIQLAEETGWDEAPIRTRGGDVMRKDIRNNTRAILDDKRLAEEMWQRAKPWIVPEYRGRWAIGLNERFRFYRYQPGQMFRAHFDGAYERANGQRSEYTFLIYLNDDFEGGGTTFYRPEKFQVEPREGTLLLFCHPQLHEGAMVTEGVKYVLRSDVMYEDRA